MYRKWPNKLCFLHVHKCAGSSVVELARTTGRTLYPFEENGNPLYAGGANFGFPPNGASPEELIFSSRIPFWKWSCASQRRFISEIPCDFFSIESALSYGLPTAPHLKTFTVLRDPVKRSLSHYYQMVEDGIRTLSLNRFLQGYAVGMDNFITRYFSGNASGPCTELDFDRALSVLRSVDLVLFVENVASELYRVEELGWDLGDSKLQRAGSSFSKTRRPIPDDLLETAEEFNRWDIKLYDACWNWQGTRSNCDVNKVSYPLEPFTLGFEEVVKQNNALFCCPDIHVSALEFEHSCFTALNWDADLRADRLLFLLKFYCTKKDFPSAKKMILKQADQDGMRAVHFYYMALVIRALNDADGIIQFLSGPKADSKCLIHFLRNTSLWP